MGGGGPGGRMPSGMSINQPPMSVSSQSRQKLKNQKLHGMTVPSSVAWGSETEVVTGKMPTISELLEVGEGGSELESVGWSDGV